VACDYKILDSNKGGICIFKKYRDTKALKKQYKAYVDEGDKLSGVWKTSSIPSVANFNGAIESYTKAIEMKILVDKPDYMVHYKRACAYEKMGEMEKAADDFRVFLLADDRELSVSYSIAGFGQALSAFSRGMQQGTARIRLTEQTLKKVLSAYDFDVGYSNKKLYNWGNKLGEARKMLKENPQEAAYRMGVILLLQENYKEAIQRLDEAVQINPEDARSHFFRGIAHDLQSRKGGLFGPSRSAKDLSKTKAISDFERAIVLTKDHALVEQANKWKKNVTSE
jgi:tetratricopeptide (TPR) repeat protein